MCVSVVQISQRWILEAMHFCQSEFQRTSVHLEQLSCVDLPQRHATESAVFLWKAVEQN